MARGAVDLDALHLVAGEAHLGLGELVAHAIVRGVQLVAGRARDVVALVRAAGQCMRSRPWWQVWQTPFLSDADILLKRCGIGGAALQVLGRIAVARSAAHDPSGRAAVRLGAVLAAPDERRVGAWQLAQTLPSRMSSADWARAVAGRNSTEQETKTAANSRAALAATALSLFTSRLLHSSRRSPGRAAAGRTNNAGVCVPKEPSDIGPRSYMSWKSSELLDGWRRGRRASLRRLVRKQREGSPKVAERRGITIYFVDGSKLRLDFPKQTLNETGTVLKLKEILAARQLVAEVDGVLLVIPFDNVRYIEAHPAPSKLPEYIIRGATIPS
jgi:hypothetical protein